MVHIVINVWNAGFGRHNMTILFLLKKLFPGLYTRCEQGTFTRALSVCIVVVVWSLMLLGGVGILIHAVSDKHSSVQLASRVFSYLNTRYVTTQEIVPTIVTTQPGDNPQVPSLSMVEATQQFLTMTDTKIVCGVDVTCCTVYEPAISCVGFLSHEDGVDTAPLEKQI